jgi:tetratricopeptide (TPR) repeat protein
MPEPNPYNLAPDLNIPLGEPVELVAHAVRSMAIRCRILTTGQPVTFRHRRDEVEGEILTVIPAKVWRFKNTWYMTGELKSKRIDISALNLTPLRLEEMPLDEEEPEEAPNPFNIDFVGPRDPKRYEMENITEIRDETKNYFYSLDYALELSNSGKIEEAQNVIENILTLDLRCLDAHHYLGNQDFNTTKQHLDYRIEQAKCHYEIGVKIGDLSLGSNFTGILPWILHSNRPYLRCLFGYALALWRLDQIREAQEIFRKILRLNPVDNQGVRFILTDIEKGLSWYENTTTLG